MDRTTGAPGQIQFEGPLDEYDMDTSANSSSSAGTDLEDALINAGVDNHMPYSLEVHLAR